MEPKDRMIVALEVHTLAAAEELVEALAPHVGCFKVGLELLTAEGLPRVVEVLHDGYGARLFVDGKFMDIPNTVAGAVRAAVQPGVAMLNVHCLGGPAMMKVAIEATRQAAAEKRVDPRPLVLGVTVLTSLTYDDLSVVGLVHQDVTWMSDTLAKLVKDTYVRSCVVRLAKLAQDSGLDGVITSPQEVEEIRNVCGTNFRIITPGVRPVWTAAQDQKRMATPADAIRAGADYLVIGRPITKPPKDIGSPVDAAKRIADEIASVL